MANEFVNTVEEAVLALKDPAFGYRVQPIIRFHQRFWLVARPGREATEGLSDEVLIQFADSLF